MSTTVNVPAVGAVKKRYLYIGAGVVVVIVGFAYYARSRGGSGGVVVDPATGSTGSGGYVNPVPDGPESGVEVEQPAIIDTNAEWGTAAITALTSVQYEPGFAAAAIGKYLAGVALTKDEATAVQVAWAMLGKPPVNPPNIILVTTGPVPGTGQPNPPPKVPTPSTPRPSPPRRYTTVLPYREPNPPWRSTLSGIAGHTGRTVAQLAEWNNVAPPRYIIHPGQRIWVDPPGQYTGTTKIS